MDRVVTGLDHPEEDEAAIALMGLASPFLKPFLPAHFKQIDDLTKAEMRDPILRATWKSKWLNFLKSVQLAQPETILVLKSPAHANRLPLILDLFPDAKFIHITRDPVDTVLSNLHMEDSLHAAYGFEASNLTQTDRVKQTLVGFSHYHKKLFHDLHLIPDTQYHRLRYEDLQNDPAKELGNVFRFLEGPQTSLPKEVRRYLSEGGKPYAPRTHETVPELRALIEKRTHAYSNRFAYVRPAPPDTTYDFKADCLGSGSRTTGDKTHVSPRI